MIRSRFVRQSVLILCLSLMATVVLAQGQPGSEQYNPREGQEGKDVIWLPTAQRLVDKMLDLAKVTPQDYVIDLGSGDGRTVITAAKRGARALGIEYNSDMVVLSKRNAAREGVADKAQFIEADLFQVDLSQATVITMFLLDEINLRLRPQILNLKPGTRIVSNTFTMGDWVADGTDSVEEGEKCSMYCTALLWIVPAKVEGVWKLPQGELTIKQNFQKFSGTLTSSAQTEPVVNGKLSGDLISFTVGAANYTGRVSGSSMQGTFNAGGRTAHWKAARVKNVAQASPENP
jgi:SAM-dependent methyltransferase